MSKRAPGTCTSRAAPYKHSLSSVSTASQGRHGEDTDLFAYSGLCVTCARLSDSGEMSLTLNSAFIHSISFDHPFEKSAQGNAEEK
jgi:hypothetical protein